MHGESGLRVQGARLQLRGVRSTVQQGLIAVQGSPVCRIPVCSSAESGWQFGGVRLQCSSQETG